MKVVIEINGKLFTGEVKVTQDDESKVFIEGTAEFRSHRDFDNEGSRILDDYQLLGWKE